MDFRRTLSPPPPSVAHEDQFSGGAGGGRSRTRSRHEKDFDEGAPVLSSPASATADHLARSYCYGHDATRPGTHMARSLSDGCDAEAGGERSDENPLPAIGAGRLRRMMQSPPYPGINNTAAFDSGSGVGEDALDGDSGTLADVSGSSSLLGVGFEPRPYDESWQDHAFSAAAAAASPEDCGGGRGRSTSCHELDHDALSPTTAEDSGGFGCDLGWGELSEPVDDDSGGAGLGIATDAEELEGRRVGDYGHGRAQEVPEIMPNWELHGGGIGFTRPARSRSRSFYEGDDDVVMACIEGETPPKNSSPSSTAVGPSDFYGCTGSNRHDSLAYSSSGEISASDLDAWTRPRGNSGLTASQATAVMSAGAGRVGTGGWGGPRLVRGGTPTAAHAAGSGRRGLLPNELQALEQGLYTPVPARKNSSDGDLSDSDEGSYDSGEDDGWSSPESNEADVGVAPIALREGFALVGDPHGSSTTGDSGRPSVLQAPPAGSHVFPPGVDPFLTGTDGGLSPPLSPRAGALAMGLGPATAVRPVGAPAFPLSHLPPPQHSPPRLHPPVATETATPPPPPPPPADEALGSLGEGVVGLASQRRPDLTVWPRVDEEGEGGDGPPEAGSTAGGGGGGGMTCTLGSPDGGMGGPLCSPPATLESMTPSGPRAHVAGQEEEGGSLEEEEGEEEIVGSPPAPPPSQLAPLPPSPLAPSPPTPRAPEASAPEAPAEPAPTPTSSELDGDLDCSRDGRGGWDRSRSRSSPVSYSVYDRRRSSSSTAGAGSPPAGGSSMSAAAASVAATAAAVSQGMGQTNPLMPPPHPPGAAAAAARGGVAVGGWRAGTSGSSFGSSGLGGGGGISQLMGPGGPFGSNRPGYNGNVGAGNYLSGSGAMTLCGSRARYQSAGSGGGGGSNLYGSAPGTLGAGSSRREQGLRGSSSVQGFWSAGGVSRYGTRRGHGGAQPLKIKLLMLGDSGVGKSSLLDRYTEDHFKLSTMHTVGVEFKYKMAVIQDEEVAVQVWDTAGQQRFHKITRAYYRGSHGIVLVYDVSDPKTLDNIAYWMKSIRDNASGNRVQICLIGNKVDLRDEGGGADSEDGDTGMVQTCSGRMIADQFGAEFFECSAKTGRNVDEAFLALAAKAFEAHLAKPPTPSSKSRRRIGRRRHQRQLSLGSDRDRPPRSDASWSTSSSLSGADSSERVESSRRRSCALDGSETSSTSTASQTSALTSTQSTRRRSFSSFHSAAAAAPPSSSSSSTSASCSPTASAVSATSPSRGNPSPSPTSQPMLLLPPRSAGRGSGDSVATLATLSPTTAAVAAVGALGLRGKEGGGGGDGDEEGVTGGGVCDLPATGTASGKKATEVEDEDSPTGTGTLSPLPGHQRSIGRSSSLGDMESFFGTAIASPKGDGSGAESAGAARRRRADTGSFVERVFGGGGGAGSGGSDGDGRGSPRDPRRGVGVVGEIVARQRQRSSPRARSPRVRSPRAGGEGGSGSGDEDAPQAVSRMKGRKPPRVPRMKRMASGDGGESGGARGKGGVCKVS